MSLVALDTSAYSAFKRGHGEVIAKLRSSERILVSSVVLGELLGGFAAGRRSATNRTELDLFLGSPRVRIAPILHSTAERYAMIYAAVRKSGQPLPTNDLWIAASAMEHGAELITLDRDFQRVAQIMVALYEP